MWIRIFYQEGIGKVVGLYTFIRNEKDWIEKKNRFGIHSNNVRKVLIDDDGGFQEVSFEKFRGLING